MAVIVELMRGRVTEAGIPVHLSRREAELVFSLAAAELGLTGPIQPAGVGLRVLVRRLRRRFGDEVVRCRGNGTYNSRKGYWI